MDLSQDKIKKQAIELEKRINNYEILIERECRLLDKLQSACGHPNLKVSDSGWFARCLDCGLESQGWYCPTSPNLECEYTDPETGWTDFDVCIHCGQPDERK